MDRVACDNAYRDLVNQINAKIMLEGAAAYENFVNFANTHIMQYKMNVLNPAFERVNEGAGRNRYMAIIFIG